MLSRSLIAPDDDEVHCSQIALAAEPTPGSIRTGCELCPDGVGFLSEDGRRLIRELTLRGGHVHRICQFCATQLLSQAAEDDSLDLTVGDPGQAATQLALRREHFPPALEEGGFILAQPHEVPAYAEVARRKGYMVQVARLPELPDSWWRM